MKVAMRAFAALVSVATTAAVASAESDSAASSSADPAWEIGLTAYPTFVRNGDNYTSAVATADHGALHLEARYDYESIGARSAFIGWTFSGGGETTWELTPLLGAAWGTTQAFTPGFEATVTHGRLSLYIEAEYVRDNHESSNSYFYAWSQLGVQTAEWLQLGVVGQRTRAYGGDRDFQRGPFAELTFGPVAIGGYWFNPGTSDQVVVASIGAAF
jgi:hypothetical protein